MVYIPPSRPWLALYGLRLGSNGPAYRGEDPQDGSPLHTVMPPEILAHILERLSPNALAVASCVCRSWQRMAESPHLWKRHCFAAFGRGPSPVQPLLKHYGHSWRRMLLERPHLRFDGLYVGRNTYIRTGVAHWDVRNATFLVVYFRYFRFFPDGSLLYRTSPLTVRQVARSMQSMPSSLLPHSGLMRGRYHLRDSQLLTALRYPSDSGTEMRCRLKLRCIVPGAYNRIDVDEIFTWDLADGRAIHDAVDLEDEDLDGERTISTRGLATLVFIPWEQVHQHILNEPVSKMDFFVPG